MSRLSKKRLVIGQTRKDAKVDGLWVCELGLCLGLPLEVHADSNSEVNMQPEAGS